MRCGEQGKTRGAFGGLFVVDQITKAEETYKVMVKLLDRDVMVYSSDHDAESTRQPSKVKQPTAKFRVDDLAHTPVAIVTQAFLRGPRGDKARLMIHEGRQVPRPLIIFDEQVQPVRVFDVQMGDADGVRDKLPERLRDHPVQTYLTRLIDFMSLKIRPHILSPDPDNPPPLLETPQHDPHSWMAAADGLRWFTTEPAERLVREYADSIPQIESVFGLLMLLALRSLFDGESSRVASWNLGQTRIPWWRAERLTTTRFPRAWKCRSIRHCQRLHLSWGLLCESYLPSSKAIRCLTQR